MVKSVVSAVVKVAQRFDYSVNNIESLLENIPEDLSAAEEIVIDDDPPLIFRSSGNYLRLRLDSGEVWDISYSHAAELLTPVTDEKIYEVSRLLLKGK